MERLNIILTLSPACLDRLVSVTTESVDLIPAVGVSGGGRGVNNASSSGTLVSRTSISTSSSTRGAGTSTSSCDSKLAPLSNICAVGVAIVLHMGASPI